MGLFQNLPIVSFFLLLIFIISIPSTQATRIEILNNCSDTVWAATNPGGGKKLNHGETWNLTVTAYGNTTAGGRIWGRTNCAFGPDGLGKCESGDCGGLLECKIDGQSPNTVAVYLLNQTTDTDLFYVSVVEGFNIPIEFRPLSPKACSKASKCAEDVNGLCPMELRDPGGCNNPCTVFSNDQFCCFSGTSICEPTSYSMFFKDLCPEAFTYPFDVGQSNACPAGTDYKVVFCPSRSRSKTSSSDTNSTDKYNTANFDNRNNCNYTVWAAAVPGGGMLLNPGETWTFDVPADSGYGKAPNTLAEFALNQFNNLDFFDISLVDGFNVPMEFSPTSGGCRGIRCTADIKGQCPNELSAPGGCNM
ncbi:hypothetical protein TIFTF001_003594 [Ficus carica]|uniref:Thaumatin-like protein n=1 Tax=Ficus carica TaxID=3494 RepID=A0AA87ZFP7_FICCA|nr:hypothetical protein TIFTF001_003594 [Ficus carica]